MAFPGMAPGMGAGQGAGLDAQQMQEQQMIKYVRQTMPFMQQVSRTDFAP